MNVGILGGSFDPIHNGHLNMALSSLEEYKLDQVWLMPAAHSPNKNEKQMTSYAHRYNMCKLIADKYDGIEVSDLEMQLKETSYTYKTLQKLKELYPDYIFYFIMGADSLDYLDKWVHPEIICQLAVILVIIRDGFDQEAMDEKVEEIKKLYSCDIRFVHCSPYNVSSTQLRNHIHSESLIIEDLDPEVLIYIRDNNLYR